LIYYDDIKQLEKFILTTILGVIEQLNKGITRIEDAEKIIFNPGIASDLQKQNVDEFIISLILQGCEIEDLYDEIHKENHINNIRIQSENLLKDYLTVEFDRPVLRDFQKRSYIYMNETDFWNHIVNINTLDHSFECFNLYISAFSYVELINFNNRLALYLEELNEIEKISLDIDDAFEFKSLCYRMEIILGGYQKYLKTISLGEFSSINYDNKYMKYINIIEALIMKKQNEVFKHSVKDLY